MNERTLPGGATRRIGVGGRSNAGDLEKKNYKKIRPFKVRTSVCCVRVIVHVVIIVVVILNQITDISAPPPLGSCDIRWVPGDFF